MLKEHEEAKDTVAYEAIKRIGAIYHLDNQLAELKLDDCRKQWQINLNPLAEAFLCSKGDPGVRPPDNNATEGALLLPA